MGLLASVVTEAPYTFDALVSCLPSVGVLTLVWWAPGFAPHTKQLCGVLMWMCAIFKALLYYSGSYQFMLDD